MTLTEELHAEAARRLADAADRLREAEADARAAASHARAVGMSVNRSAAVAQVHRSTVYRWLREAEAAEQPTRTTDQESDR